MHKAIYRAFIEPFIAVLYRNIETKTNTQFQFHSVLYQFYAKRFNIFQVSQVY